VVGLPSWPPFVAKRNIYVCLSRFSANGEFRAAALHLRSPLAKTISKFLHN